MGGSGAHEYMAPCEAGENEVALAPGYAANVEVASAVPQPVELPPAMDEPREVPTPGLTTVEEVATALGVPAGALIKAMPMVGGRGAGAGADPRRPPPQRDQARQPPRRRPGRRGAEEIEDAIGPVGFIGPVGANVRILMDQAISGAGLVAGANRPDAHLIGVEPGRDFTYESCDVRSVEVGDRPPSGDPITIEAAIEVGNIFKLGTRYTIPLGATYLDPDGVEQPIVMGCYGIGPARIVAAAVEQRADENGICWPPSIAPWQVHVGALGKGGDEGAAAADELYDALGAAGIETCSTIAAPGPARS